MRAGVAIGLVYAIIWLVWAARTPAEQRLETALHSLTCVLVLAPLLWEATARFHAISTWTAGVILLAFTVFGLAVSWRKDLLIVATIAMLAGLGTSAALLVATHDVLPFTFVLLAIAAAVEVSACLDHWLSERWLAAAAADLAVLLGTWLVTNARGLPEAYAPIPHGALLGAQVALLAIYLAGTIVRTLLRGFPFTGFEIAQCAVAFAIALGGGMRLAQTDPGVGPALAILCAGVRGGLLHGLLPRAGPRRRRTAATSTPIPRSASCWRWPARGCCSWRGRGGGLGGAGHRLRLGGPGLRTPHSTGARRHLPAGRTRGHWCAPGGCGLAAGLTQLAARSRVAASGWRPGGRRSAMPWRATWKDRCESPKPGCWSGSPAPSLAGLLTFAYHRAFGGAASHAYCATLRTAVISLGALSLAWAGAHWKRIEFSRLVYPVMALGAWRVIGIDIHQDRTTALFLSLLLYGAALILLPRIGAAKVAERV